MHPTLYVKMLSRKMKESQKNVRVINTGWTGGSYGIGTCMKLAYTRAMISAALNNELKQGAVPKAPCVWSCCADNLFRCA